VKNDLVKLGQAIKQFRKEKDMTIKELAEKAGISIGLVSKIENFRTIPSLPVLLAIAEGLDVNLAELVKHIQGAEKAAWLIVRKEEREFVERESSSGFSYEKLIDSEISGSIFQSFIVTLKKGAQREVVATDGDEFLFVIKGSLDFKIAEDVLRLNEGDSIFFDGSLPHVPINPGDEDLVFLVIYIIKQN
jgi:transcriptional regulator with XRE-family HTH domain